MPFVPSIIMQSSLSALINMQVLVPSEMLLGRPF